MENNYCCMPFDTAADERRRRMGLIDGNGEPNVTAVAATARLYSGMLYDCFRDFYGDAAEANAACRSAVARGAFREPKRRFLDICAAYDSIHKELPDGVWWIAGDQKLSELFSGEFIRCIESLTRESAVTV
ncbi:MAG: hypothetical protein LUC20_07575 [Oscillospiraceae bacterium]|nr:hypothetical protein [Oscillospiraceae bacterium]